MIMLRYFLYTILISIFYFTPPIAKPLDQNADPAIISQTEIKCGSFLLNFPNSAPTQEASESSTTTQSYEFSSKTNETIILAPNIAKLINITVSFNNTKASSLQATLDLTIPGNNKHSIFVQGSIINGAVTSLTGKLESSIYYNSIGVAEAKATINFTNNTLELNGTSKILESIKINGFIYVENLREANTPKVRERANTIKFKGYAVGDDGYKPLANIPGVNLGDLENITLKNVSFSFDSTDRLLIEGYCTFLGLEAKAILKKSFNFAKTSDSNSGELDDSVEMVEESSDKNEVATKGGSSSTNGTNNSSTSGSKRPSVRGVLLKISFVKPVKINEITSALNGTPLANLKLPSPIIFIASEDTYDPEYQLLIPKGASIATYIYSDASFLVPVKKLLGTLPPQLGFLLPLFPEKGPAVSISIALPPSTKITLDSKTKIEQLRFLLYVSPINLIASIKGSIFTRLPYQQEPVVFVAGCDFDAQPEALGVVIKGTMLGFWENVFTIKGLNLGDIALEVGVDFIPVTPFILPKTFGFRGALDLGGPMIAMGTKVSTDGDYVLEGALDGSLNFKHLINLANKIGVPIPNNVPKDLAEIRDVVAKIATKTTTIGEFVYREGIEFKGTVTLFGKTATTNINVNTHGILAEGSLDEIEIDGVLKVTGKGLAHSEKNGPAFKIALTPLEQCIYLNGSINLFGASYESDIYVSPLRAHFRTNYNLFNLVTMTLEGTSQKTKGAPDFYIRGEYKNNIDISISKKDLETALKYINNIQPDAGDMIDKINDLERRIKERHEHLMQTNKHYADAYNAVQTAQKACNDAEDQVKKIDERIKELSKRLRVERITPNQDSLLSSTKQKLETNLYQSLPNNKIFTKKQSPVLLAINIADGFKKLGGDIEKGLDKGKDIVDKGFDKTKEVLAPGIDKINEGIDYIEKGTKIIDAGSELVALKAAREGAILSLEIAQKALIGVKKTLQLADPEIAKMRAEQVKLAAQYGATKTGAEVAKLAIEGALATYPAVKWLTGIRIKEVSISAALSNPLPKFRCVVRAFDKFETVIEFNSNPEEALQYIINESLLLLKDL